MNIPKPAIWGGLAALVGVYIFTRMSGDPPVEPADDDDHAHEQTHEPGGAKPTAAPRGAPIKDTSGGKLQITEVKVGTGAVAEDGKSLSMHYRGTLLSGVQFDSSYDRGEPFTFVLGAGRVIGGWDLGVKGMKVGGKRRLIIPSALGYGAAGSPPAIPPDSTLVFDVELLDVK